MASLFVIQGADQGKRFEFKTSPVALGRDNSNAIRLHDTEVSRRHAELRHDEESYRVVDLGSANGTYLNGQLIDQAPLNSGDRLQLGQTVMLFNEGTGNPFPVNKTAARVAGGDSDQFVAGIDVVYEF